MTRRVVLQIEVENHIPFYLCCFIVYQRLSCYSSSKKLVSFIIQISPQCSPIVAPMYITHAIRTVLHPTIRTDPTRRCLQSRMTRICFQMMAILDMLRSMCPIANGLSMKDIKCIRDDKGAPGWAHLREAEARRKKCCKRRSSFLVLIANAASSAKCQKRAPLPVLLAIR